MSDFDVALERLVTDPAFKSALAADPAAALAGYQLSADEVELLGSQVSVDDGGDRTVEIRTSKASMMGLLGQFGGMGLGGGAPAAEPPMAIGRGISHEHFGPPAVSTGLEPVAGAPGHYDQASWMGPGDAPSDRAAWMGPGDAPSDRAAWMGPGDAPSDRAAWMGPGDAGTAGQHYGPAADAGVAGGEGAVAGAGDQPATGYHPHIDASGEGKWDQYTAIRHADGSVDVYEDRNHDGRVDFIGHDRNGDGILESADYDKNFDGATDVHMTDVNGDGWMDTKTQVTDDK